MKLKDLNPHPGNPRKISARQLEMLKNSLSEFGDLSGLVYNTVTKRLVGGHQRLKLLPPESEITFVDHSNGYINVNGDRFHVRLVSWDQIKEKAAIIAANKHGGDWDMPKLMDYLIDLDANNVDLELTGFGVSEVESILHPLDDEKVSEIEPEPKDKSHHLVQCPNCGDKFEPENHKVKA